MQPRSDTTTTLIEDPMKCSLCSYVYDRKLYETCPACVKHAEVERARAAQRAVEKGDCRMPDCHAAVWGLGICLAHFEQFATAPEFSRVRTAQGDWMRRLADEERARKNQLEMDL